MFASGGINDSVNIETTTGSLTVNIGDTLKAQNVQLIADSGSLDVWGTIDASGAAGGGTVDLYAGTGQNLTLHTGSLINARDCQGNSSGGEIMLGVTSATTVSKITVSTIYGAIDFQGNATLSVSGSGSGNGGSVYFRAPVNTSGSTVNTLTNMNLAGIITGARQILAEGFQYGTPTGVSTQQYFYGDQTTIAKADITVWQNSIKTFMNTDGSAIQSGLFSHLILNGGSAGTQLRSWSGD